MTTSVTQRIGAATRKKFYLEVTRGSDSSITAGDILPLRDASGFDIQRPEAEVPYYNGTMQGGASAAQAITAAGTEPCNMDFDFVGNPLKMPCGAAGYTKVDLVTGGLHSFFPPTSAPTSLTAELQSDWLEGTPVYERALYVALRSLGSQYANGGAAPLDLDFVGSGAVIDNVDLGGTVTDNGVPGVSVYNGQARLAPAALAPAWTVLGGITNFSFKWDVGAEAVPVAFNDGVAGSVNYDTPKLKGSLELMMAQGGSAPEGDFNFRNYGKNRTLAAYDCYWADSTVSATPYPTKWLRLTIATMRFSRKSNKPAGKGGQKNAQDWMHVLDPTYSKIAAEAFGTVVGPYAVVAATTDVFSVKIDGGSTINVTLTAGAARTATQIVADLSGDATFGAAAVADVFNGRVRVTSKQAGGTGASSSVQFITATSHACNAALGFNGTAITGFNTPYIFRLYNTHAAY